MGLKTARGVLARKAVRELFLWHFRESVVPLLAMLLNTLLARGVHLLHTVVAATVTK
jgi:hypothetical protein